MYENEWRATDTKETYVQWLELEVFGLRAVAAAQQATNTGSPKVLNSLRRVLPLVKNGMSSSEIHDVRGVIADAIEQLRAGA